MSSTQIPASINEITTDWLSGALGSQVSSFRSERIGEGIGLLGELARLHLEYAQPGDGPDRVIAKLPTGNEGLRTIAVTFGFYEHEVAFYADDPDGVGIRVPRCYLAAADQAAGRFALLLEDMGGGRMADQLAGLDMSDASTALRSLAGLHARWWNRDGLTGLPWAIDVDDPGFREAYRVYTQMCEPFLERYGHLLTQDDHRFARAVSARLMDFLDEHSEPPYTLNHGDFRADNLVFEPDGAGEIGLLDWQICHVAHSGSNDVANFLAGSIDPAMRRREFDALLDTYVEALAQHGVSGYDASALREDMCGSSIALCATSFGLLADVGTDRGTQLVDRVIRGTFELARDLDAASLL